MKFFATTLISGFAFGIGFFTASVVLRLFIAYIVRVFAL